MVIEKEVVSTTDKAFYKHSDGIEVDRHTERHQGTYSMLPEAYAYNIEKTPDHPVVNSRAPTICGFSRRAFFLLLGLGTLVLVLLAVGLGVGLSLGLKGSSRNETAAGSANAVSATSVTASSSTSSSTTTALATSSSSLPISTTTVQASSSSSAIPTTSTGTSVRAASCPSNNGTTIVKSSNTFKIYCDVEVWATNKINLSNNYQTSFAACLDQCASMNTVASRKDISAVYNWAGTGSQVPGTCWCVSNTAPGMGTTIMPLPGNDLALIQS